MVRLNTKGDERNTASVRSYVKDMRLCLTVDAFRYVDSTFLNKTILGYTHSLHLLRQNTHYYNKKDCLKHFNTNSLPRPQSGTGDAEHLSTRGAQIGNTPRHTSAYFTY